MSQLPVEDIVSVQPTIGAEVSNTRAAAAATDAPGPGCFATFWNKVSPCLEIGVMVGSAVAKQALVSRLANNNSLTPEQKTAIITAVSTIIEHQGKITISKLNQMIDTGVSRVVLEQLAKDTLANVTAAAEPLIEVGSTEAKEAIISRLANNNTLTAEQKASITTAVSTMIEHQGKVTVSAINGFVDGATSNVVLAQLAKDTVANVTAAAEPLIQVGSTEATEAIALRLANNNTLTAEQKAAITTAVSTMIEHQGNITLTAMNTLVDSTTSHLVLAQLAKDMVANIAATTQPLVDIGTDLATTATEDALGLPDGSLAAAASMSVAGAVSDNVDHL